MNELLPCPFYGGEAYYRNPIPEKSSAFETMIVECRHCGAAPFACSVYSGDTKENKQLKIAELWNTRNARFNQKAIDYRNAYNEKATCTKCGKILYNVTLKSSTTDWKYEKPRFCFYCGTAIERNT